MSKTLLLIAVYSFVAICDIVFVKFSKAIFFHVIILTSSLSYWTYYIGLTRSGVNAIIYQSRLKHWEKLRAKDSFYSFFHESAITFYYIFFGLVFHNLLFIFITALFHWHTNTIYEGEGVKTTWILYYSIIAFYYFCDRLSKHEW